MDADFTRVASYSAFIPAFFWSVMAGSVVVCLYRSYRLKEQPWALVAFCSLATLVGLLPAPREVWLQREAGFLALFGLAALIVQCRKGSFRERLKGSGLSTIVVMGSVWGPTDASKGAGLYHIEIKPSSIMYKAYRQRSDVDEAGKTDFVLGSDRGTLSSFGTYQEIYFDDWFQDNEGRYLSGRQVSERVRDWELAHPYKPFSPKIESKLAQIRRRSYGP